MADVLEWLTTGLAAGALLVSVLIVILARRSVGAIALAVYLGALALSELQSPVLEALGASTAFRMKLHWTFSLCVAGAGMLTFAVVYPNVHLGRGRKVVLAGIAVAAVAGAITIWSTPDVWWHDPATGALRSLPVVGPMFGFLALTIPMALLGRRWLARRPDEYRKQLAWSIVPIAWWTLHDGLGYMVYRWILAGTWPWLWDHPLREALAWLNVTGVAIVLVLMGVALTRTFRGHGASDDRALGFVLLYLLPLTLVQIVVPWHHFLDYAIIPLAVYGVLRHRVVDIDLKIKHGLKRSTVAGIFLAVFFAATTIAQEFLADSLGWLFGGFVAGLLVFALAPLQRFADRFSTAAFPHVREDSGYLSYRRYQIYKVALEGVVHDAMLDPSETAALRRLRQELGLSMDDHRLLEAEVRRIGIPSPFGGREGAAQVAPADHPPEG